MLSDSQGTTTALFKLLLKNGKTGKNELNPFWKGAFSFDDYSYKIFNDAILSKITLPEMNMLSSHATTFDSRPMLEEKKESTISVT